MPDRRQKDRRQGDFTTKTVKISLATFIFSVSLVAILVAGILSSVFCLNRGYKKGFDAGYDEGFTDGYEYVQETDLNLE